MTDNKLAIIPPIVVVGVFLLLGGALILTSLSDLGWDVSEAGRRVLFASGVMFWWGLVSSFFGLALIFYFAFKKNFARDVIMTLCLAATFFFVFAAINAGLPADIYHP